MIIDKILVLTDFLHKYFCKRLIVWSRNYFYAYYTFTGMLHTLLSSWESSSFN